MKDYLTIQILCSSTKKVWAVRATWKTLSVCIEHLQLT